MPSDETNTHTIRSTDGTAIAVHDFGGDGPPLVIAHATGFCAAPYEPFARALRDHFHVVAFDFRGHGDSSGGPTDAYDWNLMTEDLVAVVDHIRDNSPRDAPVAFGHSMGGACILKSELLRPGTFRRAFVFEPIVIPDSFADGMTGSNGLAESARRRRPTFPNRADALSRYASRPPLGVWRADALAAYVRGGFADTDDGQVTLKCEPEVEAAVFEAPGKPLASQLAGVHIPVTLAVGGRDAGPGPADFGRHAVGHLPTGELHEYPTLGHFGPFQDPTLLAEDVARFLGRA